MRTESPRIVVLYRWRIRPEMETAFVAAWSSITERLHAHHGSMGSRLHRGDDGLWYAYAQWPTAGHRERAFASAPDPETSAAFWAAIANGEYAPGTAVGGIP